MLYQNLIKEILYQKRSDQISYSGIQQHRKFLLSSKCTVEKFSNEPGLSCQRQKRTSPSHQNYQLLNPLNSHATSSITYLEYPFQFVTINQNYTWSQLLISSKKLLADDRVQFNSLYVLELIPCPDHPSLSLIGAKIIIAL